MQRRKFILGAGSAAIGGSALIGSGAFSRVESQRSVTIEVAEDPDAYLGLDGCPESPNSSYTNIDDNGHLEIDMTPENPTEDGGQGVNSDSRTWFHNVFQICNQGKQQVCVYIEDDDNWPRVGEDDSEQFAGDRRVDFYLEDNPERSIIGQDNAFHLPLGDCVCVGLRTNTKGLVEEDRLLEDIDETITIVADDDDFCKEQPIECAELESEFNCITDDQGEATGHRIDVTNLNEGDTNFGLAILNSPDEFVDVDQRFVEGNSTVTVPGRDASFPLAGLVFWEDPDVCEDIKELTRAGDWEGIETPIGIDDPDEFDWGSAPVTRNRYDEVVAIEDIDEFNAALDPDDPGAEEVEEDWYVAEIDYSGLDPGDNWEETKEDYFCE